MIFITAAALMCLVPVCTVFAGYVCRRSAKGDIGSIGYRTARSMKNREAWTFANELAGRVYIRFGIAEMCVSVAVLTVVYMLTDDLTACIEVSFVAEVMQALLLIAPLPFIEKKLRRKFDQ